MPDEYLLKKLRTAIEMACRNGHIWIRIPAGSITTTVSADRTVTVIVGDRRLSVPLYQVQQRSTRDLAASIRLLALDQGPPRY